MDGFDKDVDTFVDRSEEALVEGVGGMTDLIVFLVVLQVGFIPLLLQEAKLVICTVDVWPAEFEVLVQLQDVITVVLVDIVGTAAGIAYPVLKRQKAKSNWDEVHIPGRPLDSCR